MKQYCAKILHDGKVIETSIFARSPELAEDRLRKFYPEYRERQILISDGSPESANAV